MRNPFFIEECSKSKKIMTDALFPRQPTLGDLVRLLKEKGISPEQVEVSRYFSAVVRE